MNLCTLCNQSIDTNWIYTREVKRITYSVPMYEGKLVNPTETDEWAGFAVCERCYEMTLPVFVGEPA
jgi:hypothetical protein